MTGFVPDQPGADVRASPNFGPRREGKTPSIILLHYTGMETGAGAESWLADPASEVSAHYVVHEDGRIVQMVREAERAWHAGKSCWSGEADVNSASIGIEIVNPGHFLGYPDFPERQVEAVIGLCAGIAERHAIRPERVLAHSDVAPGRKIDPGEKFPWARLADAGIGHWVEPGFVTGGGGFGLGARGRPVEALQALLGVYGYDCPATGQFDARTRIVVEAFQRHFRPALVNGIADVSTIDTLNRLIKALPGGVVSA